MVTKEQILKYLEMNGDTENYKKLKDLIDRNVPLEDFQANLLFLNRGYGKTYMSYIKAVMDVMDKLKRTNEVIIGIEYPRTVDLDATTYDRKTSWFYGFERFMSDYYPDLKITKDRVRQFTIRRKQ